MTQVRRDVDESAKLLPGRRRRQFLSALQAWSIDNGRQLPWRGSKDAYLVWISEIMLQQTTVVAVIPYFQRFVHAFPTVAHLAAADEADVLRLWEGLGYYSRARNLHAAARTIMEQHGGKIPTDVAMLRSLPGIGRYTAGAIVSFAAGLPAPIVEANTQRLYSRLLGEQRELKLAIVQRRLWSLAEELVGCHSPKGQTPPDLPTPGQINQSLMDLGAKVCTPEVPDCPACPVSQFCRAAIEGTQSLIPRLPARPVITDVVEATAAIFHEGRYLLRQRQTDERWAGLWDFPRCTIPPAADLPEILRTYVRAETGLQIRLVEKLRCIRHSVTRYRIELHCFRAEVLYGTLESQAPLRWVPLEELEPIPLSMTGRKLARQLEQAGRGRALFDELNESDLSR